MSFDRLLSQSVTLNKRNPAAEDSMGNAELGTASTSTVKARIQQTAATEITIGRDTVVSDWQAFLKVGTDVDHQDQIVYLGTTYEVVGDPYKVPTPRGLHHLQVRLRVVTS